MNSQNQSHSHCGPMSSPSVKKGCQPPKNMMAASADTRIMLAYSARKNTAKLMPAYSTM